VHDGVTISHRGNSYAIGSGQDFYGIWFAAAPGRQPVEWWPQTPEGWQDAWSRFTSLEMSDAIVAVGQEPEPVTGAPSGLAETRPPTAGAGRFIAAGMLVAGVAVGIAGLFPGYLGGASLAQQADELVPHLIYLAGWAVSAALLLADRSRPRVIGRPWLAQAGALVAIGTSAVTFGLFLADLGTALSSGSGVAGTGLVLSLIGWLVCAAGSLLAFAVGRAGWVARPRSREGLLAVALTTVTALGVAIAFAPSWDSYTLRTPTAGVIQSVTAGNAFANPALVIAGDVAVMVVLVVAVIAAALWRPARLGAALLAGAAVPMVGQVVSALLQVRVATSPLQFGISPSQAQRAGLTIVNGLTPAFWIYCAFVAALVLIGARMLTTPPPAPAPPAAADPVTADVGGAAPVPGRTL
jgi:hypothetical protein